MAHRKELCLTDDSYITEVNFLQSVNKFNFSPPHEYGGVHRFSAEGAVPAGIFIAGGEAIGTPEQIAPAVENLKSPDFLYALSVNNKTFIFAVIVG